jgi:hypothetical protein
MLIAASLYRCCPAGLCLQGRPVQTSTPQLAPAHRRKELLL